MQGDALNQAFTRFKELADRKVEITEADLEAIVAEELGTGAVHRFDVVSLDLHGGTSSTPTATRRAARPATARSRPKPRATAWSTPPSPPIAKATGVEGTLIDFKVSSVTGGGDALGDVVVQLDVAAT